MFLFSLFMGAFCGVSLADAPTKPVDHGKWDAFLKKYVNERGEINFAAAKKDPALLNEYLDQIAQIKNSHFPEWPREETMAFWINAYHAGAIALVLKNYPVKSVNDIPNFWELKFLQLQENAYSLNDIRNEELTTNFHDEKTHFALSCLGKSCPQLSRDAYVGPKLEGQLFVAVRKFVNDPEKSRIEPLKKKVELSKFYKWYGADFTFNFGKPENDRNLPREEFAALSFIAYYLEDAAKIAFLEDGRYKIKYLPFDWSLSDWQE